MPTTGQTLWVIKPHSKGKKSSPPTEPSPGFPDGYELEDCHIFIANENAIKLPIPNNTTPTFVAVDGVEKDYETEVKGNNFNGSTIHAIFDWANINNAQQDWFSDILQLGLNSETGKRNQLKSGAYAFKRMTANPDALANLDTSNLMDMESMFEETTDFNSDISGWDTSKVTSMGWMFSNAASFDQDISKWNTSNVEDMVGMLSESKFNQDISGWDTSKVTDMSEMFNYATSFDQDLSQWCVTNIGSRPGGFDDGSGFEGQTAKQPQWGTCPSGESLELPDGYELEDCHIFVANGNEAEDGLPCQGLPTFVAVNGVDVTPTSLITRTIERTKIGEDGVKTTSLEEVQTTALDFNDGDIIHAIFDWHNPKWGENNWYSDILQIGSRSVGDEPEGYVNPPALPSGRIPNQLKSAFYAFYGMTYANSAAIANLDISNLTRMESMFTGAEAFNQDISHWDTSKVTTMEWMFCYTNFDQDISDWDVSSVTDMSNMFYAAFKFNQDLSQWCVSQFDSMPYYFDELADAWTEARPVWGTCPRGENIKLPDGYDLGDCHIFIANGNAVDLPIPSGTLPTFVAVNGVDATPTSFVTRTVEVEEIGEDGVTTTSTEEVEVASLTASDGDIIHAIFDWHNKNSAKQNWYSDIIQFGLNSETGKRNQLKNAEWAFYQMQSNPDVIANLDVSNLVKMYGMFYNAPNFDQDISGWDVSGVKNMISLFRSTPFNQDISGWNVSKVTKMDWMFTGNTSFNQDISGWNVSKVANMNQMFWDASAFNQDLSQWCVSNIGSKPSNFDTGSGFAGQTAKQPQWGTCPRGEDGA